MERSDRWHLCECGESGLPFPRGLPIVARLLVCPVGCCGGEQGLWRRARVAEEETTGSVHDEVITLTAVPLSPLPTSPFIPRVGLAR